MAKNAIDFNYAVKDGNLSVSYTDQNGKTTTKTGKEAASIFIDNGYTQREADNLIANLLDSKSYDKNADSTLSDAEIQEALGAAEAAAEGAAGPDSAGTAGPAGGAGGVGGAQDGLDVAGLDGQQPASTTEETETNALRNKSNADLAASQGEAQKNFDSSKTDMDTARTNVDEAKTNYQTATEAQNQLVQEAEDKLDYTHENYEDIKAKFGEEIANALDDVKSKQDAQNDAQNKVNELTTGVADATTAVSDATTAVSEANASLTSAQAALDSAPMFILKGTDENGEPIMEPNPEIPNLEAAVEQAEAALQQAEETLEAKKTELAQKEEELQNAQTALDEATTARDESQKAYETVVDSSEFAEDESLKAITAAVQGISQAQDARRTALDEAKEAVTAATTSLKETSDVFNKNQQALNEISREVNTRKAKGIWDPSSDKTPEEIAAEQQEEAEKAEEAEAEKEAEEAEETEEKEEGQEFEADEDAEGKEKLPEKGKAEDIKNVVGSDVTYAMVKEELKLAKENNVNLKDYVYAVGQDGIYHLYNGQTGKSIAREYGKSGSALNIWGGGYDIVGNGSGYLKEGNFGEFKNVYSYGEEPDTVKVSEKQYQTSSPLSFDLEGDGINTTNEMISYDIDGDGKLDNIFNSADAVLVFDKDHDGISGKDGSECFGDNTDLDGDGKADGYKDGFEALKALAKKENLIGKNDTSLDDHDLKLLEEKYGLKIKAGGYSSDAISLSKLGITNINLAETDKTSTDYNFDGKGSELMHQKGATFQINGEEREYADLWHRKFDKKQNFFK